MKLPPDTQQLLDKLVNDYTEKLEDGHPRKGLFNISDVPSYLYNLFQGKYKFSHRHYKQLIAYFRYWERSRRGISVDVLKKLKRQIAMNRRAYEAS